MSSETILIEWIVLLAVVVAMVTLGVVLWCGHLVGQSSAALAELRALNDRYRDAVPAFPPLRFNFSTRAKSKAHFDRLDLPRLMTINVMEQEQFFAGHVESRLAATRNFAMYDRESDLISRQWAGRSSHPRIRPRSYERIEAKLFTRRKLAYPTPAANVTLTATYTSPQGRNSYRKSLRWDFARLRAGLEAARKDRAQKSTAEYQRQRERSLMTLSLRADILRRDDYRCQMCGASRGTGATLHVDHIVPVSRGGRTESGNLQTLCDACNLGKSNRFVG